MSHAIGRWMAPCAAVVFAAALIAAVPVQKAAAQDIDDVEFNTLSSGAGSFWSSLFEPRIRRRRSFDWLSGGMPDRMIYFAGIDASKWSFGGYGGAQWAPAGFDRNGFILRLFMSDSIERYTNGRTTYDTFISRLHVLPGYMFRVGAAEVQLLAGPDAEFDLFFRNGSPNQWRTRFGLRGVADVWWEPTPSLMLQYALSGTTIDTGYSTRLALGWRVSDWFWIGPEAALSNDYFSRQTRIGAHITGFRTGAWEWSLAAGRVTDNFGREGIYSRFGIMVRPPRAPFFEN